MSTNSCLYDSIISSRYVNWWARMECLDSGFAGRSSSSPCTEQSEFPYLLRFRPLSMDDPASRQLHSQCSLFHMPGARQAANGSLSTGRSASYTRPRRSTSISFTLSTLQHLTLINDLYPWLRGSHGRDNHGDKGEKPRCNSQCIPLTGDSRECAQPHK